MFSLGGFPFLLREHAPNVMIKKGTIMTTTDSYVDWTGCELVERVDGKMSGRPIVRGTRILADTIVQDYELGESIEDIQEGFPSLEAWQITRLIEFAQHRRGHPQS